MSILLDGVDGDDDWEDCGEEFIKLLTVEDFGDSKEVLIDTGSLKLFWLELFLVEFK